MYNIGNMDETKKKLLQRRNIVENLGGNPSFVRGKERRFSTDYRSLKSEEIENIININLSGNRKDRVGSGNPQTPSQPCQTTINLYINDPHIMQKNWEKYRKTPPRRRMRNEIVLGKNIPDHTLMKNLLGDLGVKKYSSAPEMTNKRLNSRRSYLPSERYSSERSLTDSSDVFPDVGTWRNDGTAGGTKEGATFLYVNEGRSGGDYARSNIEKINEEDEKEVEEEIKNCPVHHCNRTVERVVKDNDVKEEEPLHQVQRDPLKRFKRKPFRLNPSSKNPGILYRDTLGSKPNKNEKLEQPRRALPSFHLRTQMVRDVMKTSPELLHSYESGLMRNQKKLFDSLRHKNFQNVLSENKPPEYDEALARRTSKKFDQINIEQSKLILSGKNKLPVCSVESHGTYEEYRKNLVQRPDGTLVCKNLDHANEDVWSRAGTRSIITSEFVKDKVKKFDNLLDKKKVETLHDRQRGGKSDRYIKDEYERPHNTFHGTLSHNLLNGESVTFPRETKNAMTRLASRHSKMMDSVYNSEENDRKIFATLREIRNLPVHRKDIDDSSSVCLDSMNSTGINDRYWPGVAERVRSAAAENMP
ncbi:uncharacterized protein LOC123682038 [Harmonia axyridis]|uniref:uncharacterized protein LOC123682038 n=1 Tax=Harmonia axyridis TaxID=115357 RepID=UPI001E275D9D|nr:uncharacterized protein LOC123682038 [Harmonia axyridis]